MSDQIHGVGVEASHGVGSPQVVAGRPRVTMAKFAPGIKSSAGKNKGNGSTGHGNRYLARVLGEVAVAAGRTDSFLGARYRRITRRRGKKKAIHNRRLGRRRRERTTCSVDRRLGPTRPRSFPWVAG